MRILIADDWLNVQDALRVLLEQQPGFTVVGEVVDTRALLAQLEAECPDLLLLGWELPGLAGADLLVTATGQLHSVEFLADWVCRGALVLPVHSAGWEPAVIRQADRFVVDDWQQFNSSLGGPDGFYGEMPEPHAQLGEIVAGARPGRESPDERVISFNYGLAIQDIAMASEVLRRARERGMGVRLTQLDGTMPFAP